METTKTNLVDILRLIRSENIGVKTFWNLLSLYKNATNALEHVSELSVRGGKSKPIKIFPKSAAEDEINLCASKQVKIISFLDEDYPKLLKNVDDAPPLLFCLGNSSLLNLDTFAIVGSRNASANGLRFAYKIAKNLSEHKQVVVSGFARGIDSAAHQASIDFATIAVLAGGIDHIYPPENKDLYFQIAERGLIIAELPMGSVPKAQHFPQRNRIISGISHGVAVIEASLKSGSLITAKYAIAQDRELFVMPGFPLDPRYQGNNYLLKQGAYLLESANDILEILASTKIKKTALLEPRKDFFDIPKNNLIEKELTQARIEIINLLGASPSSIEDLISITKLPAAAILTAILELELAGRVVRHFGNQISIKYTNDE